VFRSFERMTADNWDWGSIARTKTNKDQKHHRGDGPHRTRDASRNDFTAACQDGKDSDDSDS
jgi:hypothetical protein